MSDMSKYFKVKDNKNKILKKHSDANRTNDNNYFNKNNYEIHSTMNKISELVEFDDVIFNKNDKNNKISSFKSRDISYNNTDYFVSAQINNILPPNDEYKTNAIYYIKVNERNFIGEINECWIKQVTLNDLNEFRNYLIKYEPNVYNLPFPSLSILRYLPCIGHNYDEKNWDILLENKFILDEFFKVICSSENLYRLYGFKKFFTKPNDYRLPDEFNGRESYTSFSSEINNE